MRARTVLNEAQLLQDGVAVGDDDAAHDVTVAIHVLGDAVQR